MYQSSGIQETSNTRHLRKKASDERYMYIMAVLILPGQKSFNLTPGLDASLYTPWSVK